MRIYLELYKDTWAMLDSFKQLYPEVTSIDTIAQASDGQQHFLSNVLVKILSTDNKEISRKWSYEIGVKIPALKDYLDILISVNGRILWSLQRHLQGHDTAGDYSEFMQIGAELKQALLPLPELLTAMALSRKMIWTHVIKKRILASPLEIYTTLELNNRIIFIYDKILYFLAKGYSER